MLPNVMNGTTRRCTARCKSRSLDQCSIVGYSDHAVGTDHTIRGNRVSLGQLILERLWLYGEVIITGVLGIVEGDTGRRHETDTATTSNVTGQAVS